MGRAIEVDKRLDDLENKINEVLSILDELSQTNSKQTQVDLHEETKTKKTNNESDGDSSGKSNKGKSKSKAKSNVGSKGTK